jgi:hypothetical protein
LVVRDTVVAVVSAPVFAGTEVCVCAAARVAAAKTKMARDRFFTGLSV